MLALKTGARYRIPLLCRTSAGAPNLIKIPPREERPGTYFLKQFHPNNPRPNNGNKRRKAIDLFSLYVLFSHYRSCDNTLGNHYFQISSYARAYLRIIYEKTMSQVPLGPLLGKQNIQDKEVYWG